MEKLYRWVILFLKLCLITVCKIMLRHFTNKGMESRVSKLIIKRCIWLNFIGKGRFFFFFFEFLYYATYITWYERTVCYLHTWPLNNRINFHNFRFVYVVVLLSLEISPQASEKHMHTNPIFPLAILFWRITQPEMLCHVSVQLDCYLTTELGTRFQ